jgi:hypothetical protein
MGKEQSFEVFAIMSVSMIVGSSKWKLKKILD